ncbi:Type II secretory pathway, component ExeA (predicted ATPase) [Sulfurivirga caldicuralii]|uniref:Type II secretory pathway, component ExeA (Predicted ATPase) n=1 Tax=Sulfurivirga caldicuralii TaxID=364032 RepID=A0A1N6EIV3_9GAMM|nr:AAA family ATPase [Sulfurivirga caldicuralii]SIN82962.1 Type II secretory pathway, component ExeA (predicted ATPase) [Sulfurivirga caldicuralii]
MYKAFYNLNYDPFRNTPDSAVFFEGGDRKAIADALIYVIDRSEGITKVVGDVGSGKTTLLRTVAQRLLELGYQVAYVPSPLLQPEDMLRFILRELRLSTTVSSKFEMYDLLYHYFTEQPSAKGLVILIDEAHLIPRDTLEEIRLLTNLESNSQKFVQIVLFGQQELDALLDRHENRQLKSRIAHQFYLGHLNQEEVYQYLNYRMRIAGYRGERPFFDHRTARKIFRLTRGNPREINNLADKTALNAFMRKGQTATAKDVPIHGGIDAIGSMKWMLASIFFVVLLGVWLYHSHSNFFSLFAPPDFETSLASNSPSDMNPHSVGAMKELGRTSPAETVMKQDVAQTFAPPETDGQEERKNYSVEGVADKGYYVVLATSPCKDMKFISSVMKSLSADSASLLTISYGEPQQCKLLMGPYEGYSVAKNVLAKLPDKFKRLGAYVIPAAKLNKMVDKRDAKVYRGIYQ